MEDTSPYDELALRLVAELKGIGKALGPMVVNELRGEMAVLNELARADGPLSPGELWAGRQWEGMEAPLRGAYLDKLLLRASRARDGARASGRAEDLARARTFDDIYHSLTELKKEWDTWQR